MADAAYPEIVRRLEPQKLGPFARVHGREGVARIVLRRGRLVRQLKPGDSLVAWVGFSADIIERS